MQIDIKKTGTYIDNSINGIKNTLNRIKIEFKSEDKKSEYLHYRAKCFDAISDYSLSYAEDKNSWFLNIDLIVSVANAAIVLGQFINSDVKKSDEVNFNSSSAGKLINTGSELFTRVAMIKDSQINMNFDTDFDSHLIGNKVNNLLFDLPALRKKQLKLVNDIELADKSCEKISEEINSLNEKAELIFKNIEKNSNEEIRVLREKNNNADDLLGLLAGKVLASDYDGSAFDEKEAADTLRRISLACMAAIVVIGFFVVYESFGNDFKWENAIVRASLIFLISIPAAYLARESSKHREQQYHHQQKSLDLKAITPYIASLPIEDQHKLKVEVASRLFVANGPSRNSPDSYPINIHEILLELIRKVEIGKGRGGRK